MGDHSTWAANTLPLAPRGLAWPLAMYSASVTKDSPASMADAPKFPSITPRSGMIARSLLRITQSRSESTCARKIGAPVVLQLLKAWYLQRQK